MTVVRDPQSNAGLRIRTDGRLFAESESAPRDFFISRDDGQVYTAVVQDPAAGVNEETIYLKNISTSKSLVIDDIIITSDTNSKYILKFVTGTGSGTTVTPINLNKSSANDADVQALGGAGGVTGLTDDGVIAVERVTAFNVTEVNLDEGLILGQNDAIAIESLTAAEVDITIEFHLE